MFNVVLASPSHGEETPDIRGDRVMVPGDTVHCGIEDMAGGGGKLSSSTHCNRSLSRQGLTS